MTTKEFESFTRGIAHNTVKLERGIIDTKEFFKTMKVLLGKEIFDETIRIMDEE
ncbi:MAG: hypothetical protein FWF76_05260 [Oscillospiraceae bacterium]|nr:hypothetical protein [Oscillospiraceae bacterium]